MPFSTKFIGTILGIVITGMLSVSFVAYNETKKSLQAYTLETSKEAINNLAIRLDLLMSLTRQHLRIMANNPLFHTYIIAPDKKDLQEQLKAINEQLTFAASISKTFSLLILYDAQGKIIASSNPELIGQSTHQLSSLQNALEKNTEEEIYNRLINNQESYMLIFPVVENNQIVGALSAGFNLSFLDSVLVGDFHNNSGYLAVLDKQGNLLFAPPEGRELTASPWLPEVLNHPSQVVRSIENNKPVTIYSASLAKQGWIIVRVEQDSVLFSAVQAIKKSTILFTLVISLLVGLILFFVLHRFTSLLAQGIDFARGVTHGELNRTLDIKRNDELGVLADALNEMVHRLRSLIAQSEEQARELTAITNSIDGGVARFLLDKDLTILWGNNTFYTLSGETCVAGMCDKGVLSAIHPQDRQDIIGQLSRHTPSEQSTVSNHHPLSFTFRMIHHSGRQLWIYANISLIGTQQGTPIAQGVFIDVTAQKQAMAELELAQNRNRVLMELSEDIVFEYDPVTDDLHLSGQYTDFYGEQNIVHDFRKHMTTRAIINPEDIPNVLNLFDQTLQAPGTMVSLDVRLRHRNSYRYQWHSVSCVGVLDPEHLIRIIGKIVNINERKLKEEALLIQSSTDGLTRLYNKIATEKSIRTILDTESASLHALLIIDLDDFKQANDTQGHLFGDTVLKQVAQALLSSFRVTDICGRVGGDEFVVFMRNIRAALNVQQRIQLFQKTLNGLNTEGTSYTISTSIGVALFPTDGSTFLDLFQSADKALYEAKKAGKNQAVWATPPSA